MTPTAVTSAFFPEPVKIGDSTLRPFTMAQYMFLDFMRSPLLTDAPLRPIDLARALVIMTRPIHDTAQLWWDDGGQPLFPPWMFAGPDGEAPEPGHLFEREAWALADGVGVTDLVTLGEKLKSHIDREFSKAIPMRAPEGKEGSRPKEQADTQRV